MAFSPEFFFKKSQIIMGIHFIENFAAQIFLTQLFLEEVRMGLKLKYHVPSIKRKKTYKKP